MKSLSARVLASVAALSLLGNTLLFLRYSSGRPLVTFDGETITRKQYQDQLEHEAGKAVLSRMLLDRLVARAAARQGVTPTAADVDARIAVLGARAPQLLAQYAQDPAQMAALRQEVQVGIALENLRIKDVALTPAEVDAYYAGHRAEFVQPAQTRTVMVAARNEVDGETAARLLRASLPPDAIARHPRLRVLGVGSRLDAGRLDPAAFPPELTYRIAAFESGAKAGDVGLLHAGSLYLALQVTQSGRAAVPPLAQVRDQAERLARLERAPAPQAEIARLYRAARPSFDSDRYAAYFQDIAPDPAGDRKTASLP